MDGYSLKIGDKVFQYFYNTKSLWKIKRLTRTQIVLENDYHFRKKDLSAVGFRGRIEIPSEEEIKAYEQFHEERNKHIF